MVFDFSSPDGHSVNDGTRKEPFSVQCVTVDDIVDGIMSFGQTVLLFFYCDLLASKGFKDLDIFCFVCGQL